jgi:hypothetical protein
MQALIAMLRSLNRALSIARMMNFNRVLQALERVPVGAQ